MFPQFDDVACIQTSWLTNFCKRPIHLRYLLTDVPPQPNSQPVTVLDADRSEELTLQGGVSPNSASSSK